MRARIGDIELEYDTFGEPGARPLLLVMGLGTQMIAWQEPLCALLADRGFFVIRFDNRDIGLSTHLDNLPRPSPIDFVLRRAQPVYSLDDMAADAIGLLDHLGIERAHVAGASMGGMIAQLVAVNHPDRVLSLTSIMSTLGGADVVQPPLRIVWPMLMPPPRDREGRIRRQLRVVRMLAGGHPIDLEAARAFVARSIDRSYHPTGALRQLAAINAAPSRRERLRSLAVPALVIHGADDPLVPIENGRRTAAAIPSARWLEIPRMGHNLPVEAWETIVDAIADLAGETEPIQAAG